MPQMSLTPKEHLKNRKCLGIMGRRESLSLGVTSIFRVANKPLHRASQVLSVLGAVARAREGGLLWAWTLASGPILQKHFPGREPGYLAAGRGRPLRCV